LPDPCPKATTAHAAPLPPPVVRYAELEFRDVSVAKLLAATGMQTGVAGMHLPCGSDAGEAHILRSTFASLSCGVPAPALPDGCSWHVCMLTGPSSLPSCGNIKDALEDAYAGVRVAPLGGPGGTGAALRAAAMSARCVLLFLTQDVFSAGSDQLVAAAAALSSGMRFLLARPAPTSSRVLRKSTGGGGEGGSHGACAAPTDAVVSGGTGPGG